jgi:protoporphyrinogen IX oxidase
VELYPWIKSIHLIVVIFWMAGMFMMPRYLAYHAEEEAGSDQDRKWQEREQRLMRIIVNPSMILSWIFGLWLIGTLAAAGVPLSGWLHAKLLLVAILTALHIMLSRWRKAFLRGENTRSSKFYRIVNEIPSFAIIAIVILVIVKPF